MNRSDKITVCSFALTVSLAATGAGAQSTPAKPACDTSVQPPCSVADVTDAKETNWRLTLGAGLVSTPKFPGADSQRVHFLPMIGASYGRFFIGADPAAAGLGGIGVNLYQDAHWRLSTAISGGLARRKESDDPRLRGLGDVNRTASAGIGAAYTQDWFTLRASIRSDILNRGQGTLARFDARARHRINEHWVVYAGPGLTWANNRYSQTFFGVNTAQSAASGVRLFNAGSGLNSVRFSLGTGYRFDNHWGVGAFATLSRLQGDAASSPITQSTSQRFFGTSVNYRFGNASGLRNARSFEFGEP
jgi:outer membrane protein